MDYFECTERFTTDVRITEGGRGGGGYCTVSQVTTVPPFAEVGVELCCCDWKFLLLGPHQALTTYCNCQQRNRQVSRVDHCWVAEARAGSTVFHILSCHHYDRCGVLQTQNYCLQAFYNFSHDRDFAMSVVNSDIMESFIVACIVQTNR